MKYKIVSYQLNQNSLTVKMYTAWKVSKYGAFSGPYFPVFGLNIGNYGPENSPYLDTFHAMYFTRKWYQLLIAWHDLCMTKVIM